jgi:hypothetical protein
LHIAPAAGILLLLEPPLCLANLPERRARLTRAARIARRSRPPHRVGGLPHLLRRLRKIGPVALSRQPFQLARGFLSLLRQLTLSGAATLSNLPRQRLHPLPLGFLLLATCELAQFFHQRIQLLIGLLLLGALGGFVLIRELVKILLEQLCKIF